MAESDVELEDFTLGKEDIDDVHTMPWPGATLWNTNANTKDINNYTYIEPRYYYWYNMVIMFQTPLLFWSTAANARNFFTLSYDTE